MRPPLAVWVTFLGLAAGGSDGGCFAQGPIEFIDTGFENASPIWYETAPDSTTLVYLLYDHERASPNRAAGHFHFRLHARPGSVVTLEFKNLDNVWNGRPGLDRGRVEDRGRLVGRSTMEACPARATPG